MPKRSPSWPTVRAAHLKEHPTCWACGNDRDLEVHHVLPFHLFPHLELDPHNLLTLCETIGHNCHLNVGHLGSWRRYNPTLTEMNRI